MTKNYNILFLCTGNSARSIMAEALCKQVSRGRFIAYSAGSQPLGYVHPMALEKVKNLGVDTSGFRSKNWDEFSVPNAPKLDFVITVCDKAAGEVCPVWPGQPIRAHWGFPDPVAVTDPDLQKRVFNDVFGGLRRRIELMVNLPLETLDRESLQRDVQELHQSADL
jgi:arsenate reductase